MSKHAFCLWDSVSQWCCFMDGWLTVSPIGLVQTWIGTACMQFSWLGRKIVSPGFFIINPHIQIKGVLNYNSKVLMKCKQWMEKLFPLKACGSCNCEVNTSSMSAVQTLLRHPHEHSIMSLLLCRCDDSVFACCTTSLLLPPYHWLLSQ